MAERYKGIGKRPELTDRESYWLEFKSHETPASLRLHEDFLASISPGSYALEIGCAFGRVSQFLAAKKEVLVLGVDINPNEVETAIAENQNPRVEFMVMDGTALKIAGDCADAVVMTGVLGAVEEQIRKKLLQEAFRVVKPGGSIAVAEFRINKDDPERFEKYKKDAIITGEWGSRIVRRGNKIIFIAKHFTVEELAMLLQEAGITEIELREHEIETVGIGDGILEKRVQYTIWGRKPEWICA